MIVLAVGISLLQMLRKTRHILFLSKRPDLFDIETDLDNAWFGLTVTRRSLKFYKMSQRFRFTSKIPASIPRAAA